VSLPWTLAPTPPMREEPEGGSNVTKSPRNALRLIEQAESTTLNSERSRPGVREEKKATELKEKLTYVSSYTSKHSSRVGTSSGAGGGEGSAWEASLMRAACAEAVLL
jgi:hypothetical protein